MRLPRSAHCDLEYAATRMWKPDLHPDGSALNCRVFSAIAVSVAHGEMPLPGHFLRSEYPRSGAAPARKHLLTAHFRAFIYD
jgi:hypothetical protein